MDQELIDVSGKGGAKMVTSLRVPAQEVAEKHTAGAATLLTNGVFDLLHAGHAELFKYARTLADLVIVSLPCDDDVVRQKGEGRPIQSQFDRCHVPEVNMAVS